MLKHDLDQIVLPQFFAILEANYPETIKNLIVIRGESMMGMTPGGGEGKGGISG